MEKPINLARQQKLPADMLQEEIFSGLYQLGTDFPTDRVSGQFWIDRKMDLPDFREKIQKAIRMNRKQKYFAAFIDPLEMVRLAGLEEEDISRLKQKAVFFSICGESAGADKIKGISMAERLPKMVDAQ